VHATRAESDEVAQKLLLEAEYFERNAERTRYPEFRNRGPLPALESLRQAAKSSSLHVSKAPECSGPFAALTPSSPSVVIHSTAALRNTRSSRRLLPDHTSCRAPGGVELRRPANIRIAPKAASARANHYGRLKGPANISGGCARTNSILNWIVADRIRYAHAGDRLRSWRRRSPACSPPLENLRPDQP